MNFQNEIGVSSVRKYIIKFRKLIKNIGNFIIIILDSSRYPLPESFKFIKNPLLSEQRDPSLKLVKSEGHDCDCLTSFLMSRLAAFRCFTSPLPTRFVKLLFQGSGQLADQDLCRPPRKLELILATNPLYIYFLYTIINQFWVWCV